MKRRFTKYPKNYIKSSFDVHYLRRSGYGGFRGKDAFDIADIYCLTTEFEEVLGDPENARYAACCMESNISHSDYIKVLFTDNFQEANNFVSDWLNYNNHDVEDDTVDGWLSTHHYYGTVIDLIDGKEIDYGDSWQQRKNRSENTESWHRFGGV